MTTQRKKKKNLGKVAVSEGRKRLKSEVMRQRQLAKDSLRSRLESLIPAPLRFLLPLAEAIPDEEEFLAEEGVADLAAVGEEIEENPLANKLLEGQPRLAEKDEIRGKRGRYRIDRFISQRGMGNLYLAQQVSDDQPVVIKEYWFADPRFTAMTIRQRKREFERVAGLSPVDGKAQDFRLINPWEAFADANLDRCYLISQGTLDNSPTLRDYLARCGALSSLQVRHVLNQVLQTLEFLHCQKFRLPSGQVVNDVQAEGVNGQRLRFAHGNLGLDSLLLVGQPAFWSQVKRLGEPTSQRFATNRNFFVYVADLALWEQLLDPLQDPIVPLPTPQDDLAALGRVAFYLLAGGTRDRQSGQLLDPRNEADWPELDPNFYDYLHQLMGIATPFESAEVARRALLKLPADAQETLVGELVAEAEDEATIAPRPRKLWWLLGGMALILLGGLAWWLFARPRASVSTASEVLPCCINKVPAIPKGRFNYVAESQGTWNYALTTRNLVQPGRTLAQELKDRQPKLKTQFQPLVYPSYALSLTETPNPVVAAVRSRQINLDPEEPPLNVDFGITSQLTNLGNDLAAKPVAYDGLVVFVAFSYAERKQGLPAALNGKITLEQLRRLYSGEVTNWKQLNSQLPNLPVKLYIPTEAEAIQVFEERVLADPARIAQFRSRWQTTQDESFTIAADESVIYQASTSQILKQVIQDFEDGDITGNKVGAIAFSTFSKVFGYCSVYPLAIENGDRQPIQTLVENSGKAITPNTDLCGKKGGYGPNIPAFGSGQYPLAYPIAVIYPRDNSRPPSGEKFADSLRTQEGQALLRKTGLVPIQ